MAVSLQLRFESGLAVSPPELWQWITSSRGIASEMRPWLRMTFPSSVSSLTQLDIEPGQKLFDSWLLLLGLIPVGRSQLTFVEWQAGSGFTEQSPMTGVRGWRHRRVIEAVDGGTRIVDELSVEPLLLPSLTGRITKAFFRHRHRQLRKAFPPL